MPSAGTIRQNVTDAFLRFMNRREFDLAERLYHPDYVNHKAVPERTRGPQGAVATVEWLHTCFGDMRYGIERIIVEGDMAAAYVTMSGTHEGGPATGAASHPQAVLRQARTPDPLCGRRAGA